MPWQNVHYPIQAPPSYVEPYLHLDPNRRVFAGVLAALDDAVGRVVRGYQEKGLWDNTLTVFSTDNGGPIGTKDGYPSGPGVSALLQGFFSALTQTLTDRCRRCAVLERRSKLALAGGQGVLFSRRRARDGLHPRHDDQEPRLRQLGPASRDGLAADARGRSGWQRCYDGAKEQAPGELSLVVFAGSLAATDDSRVSLLAGRREQLADVYGRRTIRTVRHNGMLWLTLHSS